MSAKEELKNCAVFNGLDDETLTKVANTFKRQEFPAGSVIINYGDDGQTIFFVQKGEVNIVSEFGVVFDSSGAGSWFGEVAAYHNVKRTASVIAKSACIIYHMDTKELSKILEKYEKVLKMINETSHERMQAYLERSILA